MSLKKGRVRVKLNQPASGSNLIALIITSAYWRDYLMVYNVSLHGIDIKEAFKKLF